MKLKKSTLASLSSLLVIGSSLLPSAVHGSTLSSKADEGNEHITSLFSSFKSNQKAGGKQGNLRSLEGSPLEANPLYGITNAVLGACNAAGYDPFTSDKTCPQYLCQTAGVQDTALFGPATFKDSACCKSEEQELQGSELYFASCLATEAQFYEAMPNDVKSSLLGNLDSDRDAACNVFGLADPCCSLPPDHVGLFALCQSAKPFLDDAGAEVINLAVGVVDQYVSKYLSSPNTVKNDNNFCLNTYLSNIAYNLFNMVTQTSLDADPEKRCFDELTDPNFLFYNEQLTKQRMAFCDDEKNIVNFITQGNIVSSGQKRITPYGRLGYCNKSCFDPGFFKDAQMQVVVPFSNALFTELNELGISGEGNRQSTAPFVAASKECSDSIFLDADICTNEEKINTCKDTRNIEYKYTSAFDKYGEKTKTKKIKRTVCVDGCFEGDTMYPIEEEEYLALAQITMDRKFQAYFINEGQTCNPEIVPYPFGELCEGETDIEVTAKFVKAKSDKCYPAISDKYAKKKCKGSKSTKAKKHT